MNFFLSKIDILSLNEMTKIYECNNQNQRSLPKTGSWVRLTGGLYEKDLALVEKIVGDDKIYLKLIPRIENTKKV